MTSLSDQLKLKCEDCGVEYENQKDLEAIDETGLCLDCLSDVI